MQSAGAPCGETPDFRKDYFSGDRPIRRQANPGANRAWLSVQIPRRPLGGALAYQDAPTFGGGDGPAKLGMPRGGLVEGAVQQYREDNRKASVAAVVEAAPLADAVLALHPPTKPKQISPLT